MAVTQSSTGETQSLSSKLSNSHVGVRTDLEISRHVFFGETSYIVRDPVSFEGHNFSPSDYEILTSLRDDQSLGEVFESLKTQGIVEEKHCEDFYAFVIELQKRGLLSLPITDGESLYQQFEQRRRLNNRNLLAKVMFLKVPLGCPDRLLRSTYHLTRALFTKTFFYVWLIGLFAACCVVIGRWSEFTSDLSSLLAIQNLPAILLVMSVLKLWHEMGHGYACRHYGVSVPNAGLLFMLGTPLAFVDATGSWSLSNRWHRQVINLAGIYFELMFAIVAAFVWAFTTNPTLQSLAHFTLLISSVTTIGFNFNPLMKYDGYYVLADAMGIPNLRGKSSVAIQGLFKKIFLGIRQPYAESLALRLILIVYGFSAAVYKLTLVLGISMMIAMQVWLVGLAIGAYYLVSSIGKMLWQVIRYLAVSDETEHKRKLAICYLTLLVLGIPSLALFCPVPGRSHARGVVESETINVVHVEDGGFLTELNVQEGQDVVAGETIGQVQNTHNVAMQFRKQAELRQLELKYRSQQFTDRILAGKTSEEMDRLQFEMDLEKPVDSIENVVAPTSGKVVFCSHAKSRGQFVDSGEELLRIGSSKWIVRAVANANSLADIKPQVNDVVRCRFHANPDTVYLGKIQKLNPSGSRVVRHEALTHMAGGFIPVDPLTMEATQPFFEMVIVLDQPQPPSFLRNGALCEIRFEREYEALGHLVYRSLLRFANQIHLK